MKLTRRSSITLALAATASVGLPRVVPSEALAQTPAKTVASPLQIQISQTDTGMAFAMGEAKAVVHPVEHASFFLELPGLTIAVDPVGPSSLYDALPTPDLILVTHEHADHFDPDRLAALAQGATAIIANPAVADKLPQALKDRTTALANGQSAQVSAIEITAIPAYNTTPDRLKYHPRGRDNGYLVNIHGLLVYIAGDTEPTDEMKALKGVAVAFVPMNLPYTMTAEQAAEGVAAFAPHYVYPYHHRGTDPETFRAKLAELGAKTEVIIADWYPGNDDPTGAKAG